MIEGFLIGVTATSCLTAGLFFLKFWRSTQDTFFLGFAASFLLEGVNRVATLFAANPSEPGWWHFALRLVSLVLILISILGKNIPKR